MWFILHVARAHVIEQPSRRRDDDVDAALERVLLRPHADAAEDRRAGDGVWTASAFRSSRICAASSRVGASTSARVVRRGLSMRRFRIGSRNAAVLPLPVCAVAMTSLPCRAGGIASA